MTRIDKIHWCAVPDASRLAESNLGALAALWPAPIDYDRCFEQAGFAQFSDTDDQWDQEWKQIVGRVIHTLSQYGMAKLINEQDSYSEPVRNWWNYLQLTNRETRGTRITALERVLLSTEDDRFDEAVVVFGDPPTVTLRTRDGHPILWVSASPAVPISGDILACDAAENRLVVRLDLKWQYLIDPHAPRAPIGATNT